jgi:hypothetical protein
MTGRSRGLEIEISGYKVQIDEEDWERVKGYKWSVAKPDTAHYKRLKGNVFPVTNVKVDGIWRSRSMHRVLLNLIRNEPVVVDHINGDRCDNRRENLRICTQANNNCNVHGRKDNSSGYKGVSKKTNSDYWVSQIQVRGKKYFGGHHTTAIEAAIAYDKLAIELHGEFAHTNFPKESYIKESINE